MLPLNYSFEPAAKRQRFNDSSYLNPQIPYTNPATLYYSPTQITPNPWLTPQKMQEIISNSDKYECKILFFFPQVIQKSYNTERR